MLLAVGVADALSHSVAADYYSNLPCASRFSNLGSSKYIARVAYTRGASPAIDVNDVCPTAEVCKRILRRCFQPERQTCQSN